MIQSEFEKQFEKESQRIDKWIRIKVLSALILAAIIFIAVSLISCAIDKPIFHTHPTKTQQNTGSIPLCYLNENGTLITGPRGCDVNPHYDYSNHNGQEKIKL